MDRQTAVRRLTNRWHEQCEKYPLMRECISLALYVRRNLPAMLKLEDALRDYDRR